MFGQSLDSMVGQLTTIATPNPADGAMAIDVSDPLVMLLGGILLLVICAGGGAAAKKGGSKPYKSSDVKTETIDSDTVRIVESATGKELFKGSKMDARKWRSENVEAKVPSSHQRRG